MLTASIIRALLIDAESTSETTASFYEATRRNVRENSHLQTRRRENLKSHNHTDPCMITFYFYFENISEFMSQIPLSALVPLLDCFLYMACKKKYAEYR
jgi:hypothetical protein